MDVIKEKFLKWTTLLINPLGCDESIDWSRYLTEEADILKLKFWTETNEYTITAHIKENDIPYLVGSFSARKPKAGESKTRGNDLLDGDFSKKTWDSIVAAIFRHELVLVGEPKELILKTLETENK